MPRPMKCRAHGAYFCERCPKVVQPPPPPGPGSTSQRAERLQVQVVLPTAHFGREVYAEVAAERRRAHTKHGRNSMESMPVTDPARYMILAEEVGEVAKEFNEAAIRGDGLDLPALRAELIQVAAMAAAWADRLAFAMGRGGGHD